MNEMMLSSNGSKVLSVNHFISFLDSEVAPYGQKKGLLVSFNIANMEKSGRVTQYWSTPVFISIESCTP